MPKVIRDGIVVDVQHWPARGDKPGGCKTVVAMGSDMCEVRSNGFQIGQRVFVAGEVRPGTRGYYIPDGEDGSPAGTLIPAKEGQTIDTLIAALVKQGS